MYYDNQNCPITVSLSLWITLDFVVHVEMIAIAWTQHQFDFISFSAIGFIMWKSSTWKVLLLIHMFILAHKWFTCIFCYMSLYFIISYVVYILFIMFSVRSDTQICEIKSVLFVSLARIHLHLYYWNILFISQRKSIWIANVINGLHFHVLYCWLFHAFGNEVNLPYHSYVLHCFLKRRVHYQTSAIKHALISMIAPVYIVVIVCKVLTNYPRKFPLSTATNVKRIGTNHKNIPLIGIISIMVY